MKTKYCEDVSWEEFLDRYINNHEEFIFKYKEYTINICWGWDGEWKFSYNVFMGKTKVIEEKFDSPQELLINARIKGKTIEQIYPELY